MLCWAAMKRLKKQKLNLRSETVATLDDAALERVAGGTGYCVTGACQTTYCAPNLCSKLYSGCRSGGTSDCMMTVSCLGC
jgi:hypothetical protein